MTWGRPEMRIGHIEDKDLLEAIKDFYSPCSCEGFCLRAGSPGEGLNIDLINIELSLACQGQCALCGVKAPDWKGHYDYYQSLEKVIERLKPKRLLVQGGEVLIQKKSMEWLRSLEKKYPGLRIELVTNGNVDMDRVGEIEALFTSVSISMMAFEPATYERVMGMDFEKTLKFAEQLARGKAYLILKYLVTPVSIHEANLFLAWAIKLHPGKILFDDASTARYLVRDTGDRFWDKISERTGVKIKEVLTCHKRSLLDGTTEVLFAKRSLKSLGLESDLGDFLVRNELRKKVRTF